MFRTAPYRKIASTAWQEYFSYKSRFALEVLGGVVFTCITIFLWKTITGGNAIGPYTSQELITYLIGAGIVTSYYFLTGQGDNIDDEISKGTLSIILVRPLHPLGYWFVSDQVRKILTLFIGLIGFSVVIVFFRHDVVAPSSPFALAAAVACMALAGVIHFLLYAVFSMLSFWLDQTWGERFILRVTAELASGVIIPLTLLPDTLHRITQFLPFQFFASVPMDLYLGHIRGKDVASSFLILIAWISGLYVLNRWVLRRGLLRYGGEGI